MSEELAKFKATRDLAVSIGQALQVISIENIELWIRQAERALATGPTIEPELFADGAAAELEKQIKYMKALLEFRKVVEEIITTER